MSQAGPSDEELDEILAMTNAARPSAGPCVDDGVLVAYRDGRLEAEATDAVEAHLASCAECRALLAELGAAIPEEMEAWAKATLGRRRPRWPILGVAGAIAAAVLVALLARPKEDGLPEYALRGPLGGVEAVRGEAGSSNRFVPESRFKLVLRPKARADALVSLLVLVERPDGTLMEAPAGGISQGGGGAFRYEMKAGRLFGDDYGMRTVHAVVVVGPVERSELQGSDQEVRRRLPAHRWMTVEVEYKEGMD